MKMKQLVVPPFIALLFLTMSISQSIAQSEVSGDVYVGISSKYLWRGFDLSNDEPVVQGGADISYKGLTLSYWANYDLDTSELNETDLTIDYTHDLGEYVSVSVGNIFYILKNAEDTNELYLGITGNTLLAPTLTIYYDYDAAEENGLFYTFSISHGYSVSETLNLSAGALVSYNDESDYSIGNYSAWHNIELSASADYAINDQLSISPYAIYSDALSNKAETVIEDELVGGLNLTYTF